MDIFDEIEIYDCPQCGGAGLLEEEGNSGFLVTCMECGCHSVVVDFSNVEGKLQAAKKTAKLWNCGKVISISPGE